MALPQKENKHEFEVRSAHKIADGYLVELLVDGETSFISVPETGGDLPLTDRSGKRLGTVKIQRVK